MHGKILHQAKILIVDDESSHVDFLKTLLRTQGYTNLTSILDPCDALDRFHELQPDLILLDILMPGIGGMQLLKKFREVIAEDDYLPILVVTADLTPEVRREALVIGASDFVIKPYESWEMLSRIRNLLATRSVHCQLAGKNAEIEREMEKRREAEAALRQEHENLRDYFENAPMGLHWVGEDGAILWANQAELDLAGYSAEEYIGRPITDFHADEEVIGDILTRLVNKETLRNHEARLLCKDGSIKHVLINSNVLWRDGKFVHTRCFTRDITDRKAATDALRCSEEKLNLAVVSADIGTWDWDVKSNAVACCARTARMFGLPAEGEIDLEYLLRAVYPDDRPSVEAALGQALEDRGQYAVEYRIGAPGQPVHWITARGRASLDASGKATRMTGTVHDITERKRVDEALRESEGRYHRIVANSPGMVYQFLRRPDGTVSFPFVSEGCRELFGMEPAEILADANVLISRIDPADEEAFIRSVDASAATLEDWRWEGRFLLASGQQVWLQGASRPERQENGDILWDGLVVDITERKRIEQTATDAREEAERANAAKSEFLSRMSHELRTPLNAILGFAQLFELDAHSKDERENVEQILKGGRHLLRLINEVLDISRIEANRMTLAIEPVSIRAIADSTLTLLRPVAAPRKIQLEARACEQSVLADAQRLQQVLLNLVSNAIKYNVEGGSVTISCGAPRAGMLRIEVRDTGVGIPRADVEKLFLPFERLGNEEVEVEGIGLGLAISKRLVELMGGAIGVESEPGAGTTFWIELPQVGRAAAKDPAPAMSEIRNQKSAIGNGKTLLYIEDNLSNLLLIEKIMEQRTGIRVLAAQQARIGLELARHHQPDLILLDLHLPDMNGADVLTALRAHPRTARIPVVMISVDSMGEQVERLMNLGASAYLPKPFKVQHLLQVLDSTLVPCA